jgi:hypothetical protein
MQKSYSKLTPFSIPPTSIVCIFYDTKKVALGENPFNKKAFSSGDRIVNVCSSSGGGKVFNRNHVIMQMVMSNLKQYISIIASQVIIKRRKFSALGRRSLPGEKPTLLKFL